MTEEAWGVPPEWCTPDALTQVQDTGRWLLENKIIKIVDCDATSATCASGGQKRRRIHVEIITDSSHRDVDTAFAFAEGLKKAAKTLSKKTSSSSDHAPSMQLTLDGLNDLHYDHWLFKPFEDDTAGCKAAHSEDEMLQAVQDRLSSIPPPSTISRTAEFVMETAGIGRLGNLSSVFSNNLTIDPKSKKLEGAPVFFRHFAQWLFYSRAGNITHPYLQGKVSQDQVYDMLQWVHWSRTVTEFNNPLQATIGSVLAQGMLRVLKHGSLHSLSNDSYDTYVTILAGHDGNLESLATALGASWSLPAPYRTGLDASEEPYRGTPPLSGLHVERSFLSKTIKYHFLTPVYSSIISSKNYSTSNGHVEWVFNASGILEQVPLEWRFGPFTLEDSADIGTSTGQNRDPMTELERQIKDVLGLYTGAMACFEASRGYLEVLNIPQRKPGATTRQILLFVVPLVVLSLLLCIACIWTGRRRRQRAGTNSRDYSGVANTVGSSESELV